MIIMLVMFSSYYIVTYVQNGSNACTLHVYRLMYRHTAMQDRKVVQVVVLAPRVF